MTDQRVTIVPSRHPEWVRLFEEMAGRLALLLPGATIEHIGSTSVPALPAKDVVDLLIGVDLAEVPTVVTGLTDAGFDLEGSLPHHAWFGFPSRDDRRYVIHVVEFGSRAWQRRIDFRDLLRRDPEARATYLAVKLSSAEASANWDEYTQSKSDVVAGLLDRA